MVPAQDRRRVLPGLLALTSDLAPTTRPRRRRRQVRRARRGQGSAGWRLSEPRRQERPVLARQLYAIHRRRRELPAPHFLPRRTAGIIRVADAPHKTGETEPEVKIPTKSPQHTRPTSPHANTARYAFPLVRGQILGSRDRTRTYNLPVNRRPVMAGSARGCH